MIFLKNIFTLLFWSFTLSFIPISFFLIIKESQADRDKRERLKDIYIIRKESEIEKEKKDRIKVILSCYCACLAFFLIIYFFNFVKQEEGSVSPFDILSAFSVVLFWLAILSYLPVALYLILKEPQRYEEEGIHLKKIFVFYSFFLFIFSFNFIVQWLQASGISTELQDLVFSFFIIILCSAVLSYFPILVYIFLKESNPFKRVRIRFKMIFVIYCICFLFFSSIYTYNWISDRKAGINRIPWRIYFRL